MDNDRADVIDKGKQVLKWVFIHTPLNFIEKKFGHKIAVAIIVAITLVILGICAIAFFLSMAANWKTLSSDEPKQAPFPIPAPFDKQGNSRKTPMQDVKGLESYSNPCNGELFDVVTQLDDVWGNEKPFPADKTDPNVISASGSANAQVTKRYPYSCKPPWEIKLLFVPLKEQSIGVFIEYEDVFKIILGDGDRQTWKIEKNDSGRKNPWTEVIKEKLTNGKISVNKEVTVNIVSKQIGNNLELSISFRYVPEGKNDYIWEERKVNFEAKATDLVGLPARPIRIGLNDSRYRGAGSEIQFGIFSIKELR